MNTLVQTRVDAETKKEAEAIMKKLGITLGDAVRMFISQIAISKGLPFKPTTEKEYNPNARLRKIIDDMEKEIAVKSYNNAKEMFDDLDKE